MSDLCILRAERDDCRGADAGFLDPDHGKAITHPLVTALLRRYVQQGTAIDAWLQPPFTDGFPARIWSAGP